MSIVMQRFKKGNSFGTKPRKLTLPVEYKAKKRLIKTWPNPYTEKEEVGKEKERLKRESLFSYDQIWTGHERRGGWMDKREEVLLRDGPICAICKRTFHPSELEIDHNIARKWFKNPADADRLENLQVLCTECHRAKTKSDLKVESRMP
jgi:5-methylcytosine-specific restriction endonuclease McrA